MQITKEQLAKRFMHHKPSAEVGDKMSDIRQSCCTLAQQIVNTTPEGREQSLAITKLEEVMFWANAALARS